MFKIGLVGIERIGAVLIFEVAAGELEDAFVGTLEVA